MLNSLEKNHLLWIHIKPLVYMCEKSQTKTIRVQSTDRRSRGIDGTQRSDPTSSSEIDVIIIFLVFLPCFCFLLHHFHIFTHLFMNVQQANQEKPRTDFLFVGSLTCLMGEKTTLRCAEFRLRYQGIRCVLLVSRNWVFN